MKDGTIGYSAPCIDCTNYLKSKGFKKVYYTDTNGEFIKVNIQNYKTNHISLANRLKSK